MLDVVHAETVAGHSVGVTDLTHLLSVDQPRVSKLVKVAVSAGMLRRVADQDDGRRSSLELTSRGSEYIEVVRAHRSAAFAEAVQDWSARDRKLFAALLTRFVAGLEATDNAHPAT